MTPLYDSNPDISYRESLALKRAVAPKVRQKAAGANGARFCGVCGEAMRPPRGLERGGREEPPGVAAAALTALTRGPGGVAQCCGSSRPAAATARAATHHAAALMAGPGGPGSARLRSARSGRAGVRETAAQQKREPDAEVEQPSRTTPELDPARSRRCACVLPAASPGASGRRLVRRLRRFRPRLSFQKTRRFLEKRQQHLLQDY